MGGSYKSDVVDRNDDNPAIEDGKNRKFGVGESSRGRTGSGHLSSSGSRLGIIYAKFPILPPKIVTFYTLKWLMQLKP